MMNLQMLAVVALSTGLLATVVSLVFAATVVRRLRRVSARQQGMLEELTTVQAGVDRIRASLHRSGRERLRLARQILSLEGDLDGLRVHTAQVAGGPSSGLPDRVLDGAIRRVREGADASLLVREYGMSLVEAELLAKLHSGPVSTGVVR